MIVKSNLKIKILLISTVLFVLSNNKSNAQKAYSSKTYYKIKERKNAVKVGLPALFFNNINLKYQRGINERLTFQISWAKYYETDLVKRFEGKTYNFREYEADLTNFNEDKFYSYEIIMPELKLTGFYTQAEIRYQFSKKKLLTGFYAGPFCAYHKIFLDNVNAYDNVGFNYSGQIDLSVFNTGIQTGYQWLIKKFIIVDFHFLGAGWLWANHNSTFTTNNSNMEFEKIIDDLDNSLSTGFNFRKIYYDISTLENGLTYQIKVNSPMLRTGLSVGILF